MTHICRCRIWHCAFTWASSALILLMCLTMCVGCTSTSMGIYNGARSAPSGTQDVLIVDMGRAVQIAYELSTRAFTRAEISSDGSRVIAWNSNFFAGDVQFDVEPVLLSDPKSNHTGITFKFTATGIGANPSIDPGYCTRRFLAALDEYRKTQSIPTETFTNAEVLHDKGVADKMPATVPTTEPEFQSFITQRGKLADFEGIWTTTESTYRLGMVYDKDDTRAPYKCFVLSSERPNWRAGEIKVKFSRLSATGISLGIYGNANKAFYGLMWEASSDLIRCVNPPANVPALALVRVFPTTTPDGSGGRLATGTAWALTQNVLVTAAHVVDGVRTISIHTAHGKQVPARVLSADASLDIAFLEVTEPLGVDHPLPIAGSDPGNGSSVVVLGFPLTTQLGNDIRVTAGIVSSQSGYDGEASRLQVSAAIQPGNSGGPVINDHGAVIGVVSAKLISSSHGVVPEGVGFAVRASYLRLHAAHLQLLVASESGADTLTPEQIAQRYEKSVFLVVVQ